MSRSHKTTLARRIHKAANEIWDNTLGSSWGDKVDRVLGELAKGGVRYGNQRKMRSRWKWKDRKSERAKSKGIDLGE